MNDNLSIVIIVEGDGEVEAAPGSGRSRSFRRLCHAVEELARAIDESEAVATPVHG